MFYLGETVLTQVWIIHKNHLIMISMQIGISRRWCRWCLTSQWITFYTSLSKLVLAWRLEKIFESRHQTVDILKTHLMRRIWVRKITWHTCFRRWTLIGLSRHIKLNHAGSSWKLVRRRSQMNYIHRQTRAWKHHSD